MPSHRKHARPTCSPAWLLLGGLLAVGCCPRPTAPAADAGEVLRQYAAHLRHDDPKAALALVSHQRRQTLDPEELGAFVRAGGAPLQQLLAVAGEPGLLPAEWRLRLADGRQISLVRESGQWRIDQGPVLPPVGATAQEAMDGFLEAIAAGDCQALVRWAPPQVRSRHPLTRLESGCAQQLEVLRETAARIQRNRAGLVQVAPDRAELAYSEHRKLVLVLHEARWYIEDL